MKSPTSPTPPTFLPQNGPQNTPTHSPLLSRTVSPIAASSAAAHIINVTGVLRFVSFGVLGTDPVPIHCDNEACVLVSKDATAIKRLAYVTRRVRLLQELVAHRVVYVCNVPGVTPRSEWSRSHARIRFDIAYERGVGRAIRAHTRETGCAMAGCTWAM